MQADPIRIRAQWKSLGSWCEWGYVITGVITGAMGRLFGPESQDNRSQTADREKSKQVGTQEPTGGSCLGASSPGPSSGLSLLSCSWFLRSFNSVPSLLLTYRVPITGIQKSFHGGSDSQFTERLHMLFCLDSVSHATPGRGQGGIIT